MRQFLFGRTLLRLAGKVGRYLNHAAEHGGEPKTAVIGRHSYGLTHLSVESEIEGPGLTVGNFCSIAPGVRFLLGVDHPTGLPSTFPFRSRLFGGAPGMDAVTRGSIVVGHDVWIGRNALVLSGVTIGTGAVVGAGAVVARDVAPYAIVVGSPAREVRKRFADDVVVRLLASQWWDLPDNELQSIEAELYSPDINVFLAAVERIRARP